MTSVFPLPLSELHLSSQVPPSGHNGIYPAPPSPNAISHSPCCSLCSAAPSIPFLLCTVTHSGGEGCGPASNPGLAPPGHEGALRVLGGSWSPHPDC